MVTNLLKTNNKATQIIFLTFLVKLLLYDSNTKNTQSLQESIACFLSIYEYERKQLTSTKELLLNFTEETPTKLWVCRETVLKSMFKKNFLKSEQCQCQNIEYSYFPKTISLPESFRDNFKEEIIDTFIQRISSPSALHLELINNALNSGHKRTITIISSFTISKQKSECLITALRKKIAHSAKIEFKIKNSITNKIELHDRGYKIFCNLRCYITELETETSEVLA